MSNIITSNDPHAAQATGLRELADFLEQHPQVKLASQRMLVVLDTNDAVDAFAAEHGLTVEHDEEGNASCNLVFGPVVLHAYDYVDFEEHCARNDERQARQWAESQGLTIAPAGGVR